MSSMSRGRQDAAFDILFRIPQCSGLSSVCIGGSVQGIGPIAIGPRQL